MAVDGCPPPLSPAAIPHRRPPPLSPVAIPRRRPHRCPPPLHSLGVASEPHTTLTNSRCHCIMQRAVRYMYINIKHQQSPGKQRSYCKYILLQHNLNSLLFQHTEHCYNTWYPLMLVGVPCNWTLQWIQDAHSEVVISTAVSRVNDSDIVPWIFKVYLNIIFLNLNLSLFTQLYSFIQIISELRCFRYVRKWKTFF